MTERADLRRNGYGPRIERFPMAARAPVLADWPGHPPLTLLVDPDADTRHMYGEYLKMFACTIDEAEDGRAALAKVITRHPDIVVSETRLPGISGFQLCEIVRADPSTQDIPIIFVTADASDQQIRRARLASVDAILVKPCLPETLLTNMKRLLSQAAALSDHDRPGREPAATDTERSRALIAKTVDLQNARRPTLSRSLERRFTTEPPAQPPSLICPACAQPLAYQRSHIGGVSVRHQEQWDYYECAGGCGTYQYRQRTRKLRRVT